MMKLELNPVSDHLKCIFSAQVGVFMQIFLQKEVGCWKINEIELERFRKKGEICESQERVFND